MRTLSVRFSSHFSRWTWVSRYQNVSILDFIGAKDDGGGGDNWSHKTCKAPVKSSLLTNTQLLAGCMSCCRLTNSVNALKRISSCSATFCIKCTCVCEEGYSLSYNRNLSIIHLNFCQCILKASVRNSK